VEIVSKGREGYIGVGFCTADVNMDRLPGWEPQSYGYHGDDGNAFRSDGKGRKYGPQFETGASAFTQHASLDALSGISLLHVPHWSCSCQNIVPPLGFFFNSVCLRVPCSRTYCGPIAPRCLIPRLHPVEADACMPLECDDHRMLREGESAHAGDLVGACLNRVDKTISYYKNGIDLGVAFHSVQEERLYPCVGMQTHEEEVRYLPKPR